MTSTEIRNSTLKASTSPAEANLGVRNSMEKKEHPSIPDGGESSGPPPPDYTNHAHAHGDIELEDSDFEDDLIMEHPEEQDEWGVPIRFAPQAAANPPPSKPTGEPFDINFYRPKENLRKKLFWIPALVMLVITAAIVISVSVVEATKHRAPVILTSMITSSSTSPTVSTSLTTFSTTFSTTTSTVSTTTDSTTLISVTTQPTTTTSETTTSATSTTTTTAETTFVSATTAITISSATVASMVPATITEIHNQTLTDTVTTTMVTTFTPPANNVTTTLISITTVSTNPRLTANQCFNLLSDICNGSKPAPNVAVPGQANDPNVDCLEFYCTTGFGLKICKNLEPFCKR